MSEQEEAEEFYPKWDHFPLLQAYLTERGDFPTSSQREFRNLKGCIWTQRPSSHTAVIIVAINDRILFAIYSPERKPMSETFGTEDQMIAHLRTVPIESGKIE